MSILISVFILNYQKLVPNNEADLAKMIATVPAAWYYGWNGLRIISVILLFIITGLALYERMQAKAPYLTLVLLIAGSAGAAIEITRIIVLMEGLQRVVQDSSALKVFWALANGLEVASGHAFAWSFLVSGCAILRTRALSRALGWFDILVGILWIPQLTQPQTMLPQLIGLLVFLLSLVAALWTGIALLRQKQPQEATREMAEAR